MKKQLALIFLAIMLALLQAGCQNITDKKVTTADTVQVAQEKLPEKITFPSLDSLPVTANLYIKSEYRPFIVLCHMAGFNKSEYRETALKLVERGYNCLAIDQRSGGETSGYENETYKEAMLRGLGTTYPDAEQDIIAAVNYISEKYKEPVILWGSSYSASLALKIGKTHGKVRAIIAFSPGEYFAKYNMVLKDYIRNIGKPVFITSSRDEANNDLMAIIDAVGPNTVTHYKPSGTGAHGSQVLWDDSPDKLEYWKALDAFLGKIK